MAGEYIVNLSNGTVLTTLRPLEVSGPSNRSTPRLILQAKPSFPILSLVTLTTFKISGNHAAKFPLNLPFTIVGGPNA